MLADGMRYYAVMMSMVGVYGEVLLLWLLLLRCVAAAFQWRCSADVLPIHPKHFPTWLRIKSIVRHAVNQWHLLGSTHTWTAVCLVKWMAGVAAVAVVALLVPKTATAVCSVL